MFIEELLCATECYWKPMGGSSSLGLSNREDPMKVYFSWVLIIINIIMGKGNMKKGILSRKLWVQSQQTFTRKSQIGNTLDFMGHLVSAATFSTLPLWHKSNHRQNIRGKAGLCSSNASFTDTEIWFYIILHVPWYFLPFEIFFPPQLFKTAKSLVSLWGHVKWALRVSRLLL